MRLSKFFTKDTGIDGNSVWTLQHQDFRILIFRGTGGTPENGYEDASGDGFSWSASVCARGDEDDALTVESMFPEDDEDSVQEAETLEKAMKASLGAVAARLGRTLADLRKELEELVAMKAIAGIGEK